MSTPPEGHTRTRNPRGQGDRLRDEIVAAAAAVLDEAGTAEAVTLRAVARRAGISAPSIYRHFPDPPAILLAVAQEAFEMLRHRLAEAAESERGGPTARLQAVCGGYLRFAEEHPSRYRVMFGGVWRADPDRGDSLTEASVLALGAEALEVLAAGLAECVADGTSLSTDVRADATALWLGLHGLAHQRAVAARFPWPEDIETRMVRLLASLDPAR
ncbi:TetR/AcrR family transcriptional regulator [Nocardioides sp. 503]|uniref:TetR/AcrR family transcriptional regulator n=1 Tax=Nocardioides sp. 503 TaxID=2508326 RepID=UPI001ADC3865|nr:TetR/AcrR family transcriptional regulator [Nocardioides sp. 503]